MKASAMKKYYLYTYRGSRALKFIVKNNFLFSFFRFFFWIDSIEERRDIQIFSVSNLKCEIVLRLLRISTK